MMKKQKAFISTILVFVVCLWGCWISFAAPVGNPAGPVMLDGKYPTKFTLQAEAIRERGLESSYSGNPELRGALYTGKVSFYLGKKFDLYGLAGVHEGKTKDFIGEHYILDSKMDIAWGFGASYVLYEFEFLQGLFRIGADAQYRQFDSEMDDVKYYRETTGPRNTKYRFKEWQGALGLAYQYKSFIPYIGGKYSNIDSHMEFTHDSTSHSDKELEASDNFGVYGGIDILLNDFVSLNIEGRAVDESAVSVGLSARF